MPRPAMLVEIVTAPSAPARATIAASSASFLAFSTSHAHARAPQPLGQALRFRHAGRSDQHRTACGVRAPNLVDDRALLRLAVREDEVVSIDAGHRAGASG